MRHVLVPLILLFATGSALGQHGLGAREQWQPRVADTDVRLQQPVEIEILGRAAVPALELLSEETGVSLGVAPENLDTVGERKLTIISKGLTLKTIMVQIPEALQECHWDIDRSGEEPVYLLHRDSGVEGAIRGLMGHGRERTWSAGDRGDPLSQREHLPIARAEPTDPVLLRSFAFPDCTAVGPSNVLQAVAAATGLAIVSDFFTDGLPHHIPSEAAHGVPLWRLLDTLRREPGEGDVYCWRKAGECLVFYHRDWYERVPKEIPDGMIVKYRERLQTQGELTLDDLAELAGEVIERVLRLDSFPPDLRRAGVCTSLKAYSWALLLYASLTPDQIEKLRSPEGLRYHDMTADQQRQIAARAASHPLSIGKEQLATFHLRESTNTTPTSHFHQTYLELRFPEIADEALVKLQQTPLSHPAGD